MRRWKSIAAVAVVFLCGVVVGGAGVLKMAEHRWKSGEGAWARSAVPRFARELGLSAGQREAVRPIFAEAAAEIRGIRFRAQPEIRAVLDNAAARIREVLDPEQRERFEVMRARARERWGAEP